MAKKEFVDIDQDTSELEAKLAKHDSKESDQEIVKPKKSEISNAVREKMEAMTAWNLKPVTIGVKAELEFDDDLRFTIIAKKLGKDKQELAAEYILQGLEKDMKKIGIFDMKK